MYGTVARMRLKPGAEARMRALMDEYEDLDIRGYQGQIVYRTDSDPNEYIIAVLFDSKEDYEANANDPAQHERFLQYRALLESDPEWMDGEIISQTVV
jgi:heme-degrading monooxygenase HmoA